MLAMILCKFMLSHSIGGYLWHVEDSLYIAIFAMFFLITCRKIKDVLIDSADGIKTGASKIR